jgi:transcriptional regulator with XRE-family HTH domain
MGESLPMVLTIQPELETKLRARAAAGGLTVEEYLERLVRADQLAEDELEVPASSESRVVRRPLPKADTPAQFQYGAYKSERRSKDLPYLNVAALARKVGVSRSHLNKWLKGTNRLSVPVGMKLAEALNMPLAKVLALGGTKSEADAKAKSNSKARGKGSGASGQN